MSALQHLTLCFVTHYCALTCLQAVLSGGQVYAVDRMDVTRTPDPPATPVTLPSLMWSEVAVQVRVITARTCELVVVDVEIR